MTEISEVYMADFFRTVGEVRSLIENISRQTEELERRHAIILSSPNQETKYKDEIELINYDIKKNADLIRTKIKVMQEELPAAYRHGGSSATKRIQKNQHSHLTWSFAEVMRNYHKAQISFREKCKAHILRQLEIVGKVTSDEELEGMLNCDKSSIFICDLKSDARISGRTLGEIECRHHDIVCLESSIRDLQDVFADSAMLLEIQGELINNIENTVMSAAEYIDVSKGETNKAVTYKKNPYKVASLPRLFKPFKRQTSAKLPPDQNTVKHD